MSIQLARLAENNLKKMTKSMSSKPEDIRKKSIEFANNYIEEIQDSLSEDTTIDDKVIEMINIIDRIITFGKSYTVGYPGAANDKESLNALSKKIQPALNKLREQQKVQRKREIAGGHKLRREMKTMKKNSAVIKTMNYIWDDDKRKDENQIREEDRQDKLREMHIQLVKHMEEQQSKAFYHISRTTGHESTNINADELDAILKTLYTIRRIWKKDDLEWRNENNPDIVLQEQTEGNVTVKSAIDTWIDPWIVTADVLKNPELVSYSEDEMNAATSLMTLGENPRVTPDGIHSIVDLDLTDEDNTINMGTTTKERGKKRQNEESKGYDDPLGKRFKPWKNT